MEDSRLFEYAPVAMWEADCVALQAWLNELRAGGLSDVREFLRTNVQQVLYALSQVTIRRVNRVSVGLFGARDEQHLREYAPLILASIPLPVLINVLVARWENRPSYRTRAEVTTLQGTRLEGWVGISVIGHSDRPEADGPDLSRVVLTFTDTIPHTRGEESRRGTEERLRIVLQAGGMGWWDWDLVSDVLVTDDQCKALFGLPPTDEVTYEMLRGRVIPEDLPRVDETLRSLLAEPREFTLEVAVQWPDGSQHWILIRGRSVHAPSGRPLRIMGVDVDLTPQRQAEEAIQEHEELLRLAEEGGKIGSFSFDLRTGRARVSRELLAIYGEGDGAVDAVRESWLQRVHPEDRERIESSIQTVRPDHPHWQCEFRILRPEGEVRWIESRARMAFDAHGQPLHAVGVNVDITDRKRAEEALRESAEFYKTLLDTLPVGVVLADPRGAITYVSAKARQTFAVPEGQGLGTTPLDWIAPEHHPMVRERMRRVLVELQPQPPMEYRMHRFDGASIWAELASAPFFDGRGHLKGVITVCTDVTRRKHIEEELQQAKMMAEEASLAKSQFLANMSHELRTPMNAILGMTELALQEELSPIVRDSLETAKESADTLLMLINEILDLSRIEAGMLALESSPIGLRALLDGTMRAIAVRADEKGLELVCDVASGVPDRLMGDGLRLRQILTNLVGNAIKFTERGQIVVRVERDEADLAADAGQVGLRFAVSDTGIGIAPEHHERIFSPFAQADTSTTRRYGGSGLGLSIVASLVEMLGGRLWLESRVGHGSTFFFTLQLKQQPGPEPAAYAATPPPSPLGPPPPAPRQLRVLVAEDTPANQKLALRILEKRGHSVEVVDNGAEAVARLRQQPFDVVLMDVQMPIMDGFQATAAIRALPEPHKAAIPIIAMTAHALKGDQERCLAAGMDAYLSKPVNARELTDLVEQVPP